MGGLRICNHVTCAYYRNLLWSVVFVVLVAFGPSYPNLRAHANGGLQAQFDYLTAKPQQSVSDNDSEGDSEASALPDGSRGGGIIRNGRKKSIYAGFGDKAPDGYLDIAGGSDGGDVSI